MTNDNLSPETQAEIAAIIFESQEKDRWMRLNSFMYRHQGWFMAAAFVLILSALAGMFIDGYRPDAQWRMWTYLAIGWSGVILLYSCFFVSETKNGFGAIIKALIVLTVLVIVIIPIYAGFLVLMNLVLG